MTFLKTDDNGYLRVEYVSYMDVIQLIEAFYKLNLETAKKIKCILPVTVTKFPNEFENNTKVDFFISGAIERFSRHY